MYRMKSYIVDIIQATEVVHPTYNNIPFSLTGSLQVILLPYRTLHNYLCFIYIILLIQHSLTWITLVSEECPYLMALSAMLWNDPPPASNNLLAFAATLSCSMAT